MKSDEALLTDYVTLRNYSALPLPPDDWDIALPPHLWGKTHNDWPIFKNTPRGKTASGPRAARTEAGTSHPQYLETPPKLVKGYGIGRWMAVGNQSVLYIPLFDNDDMMTEADIPEIVQAKELKPSTPLFEKDIKIRKKTLLTFYGPSSLQKFTNKSYLLTAPFHVSGHRMIRQREHYAKTKAVTGADLVWFWRYGNRWDSLDDYYNTRSALGKSAYAGFRWN